MMSVKCNRCHKTKTLFCCGSIVNKCLTYSVPLGGPTPTFSTHQLTKASVSLTCFFFQEIKVQERMMFMYPVLGRKGKWLLFHCSSHHVQYDLTLWQLTNGGVGDRFGFFGRVWKYAFVTYGIQTPSRCVKPWWVFWSVWLLASTLGTLIYLIIILNTYLYNNRRVFVIVKV